MNTDNPLPGGDKSAIPNQVKLPLAVAFGVVMQGLKIRIGRSLVTITGVTCGIAFLMSILTGQLVKKGVAEEDECRIEVQRILSFVRSELPKLDGKTIGIVGGGVLGEVETRILSMLAKDLGAKRVIMDGGASPTPKRSVAGLEKGDAAEGDVVFYMGEKIASGFDFGKYSSRSLNSIVASTIPDLTGKEMSIDDESKFISLSRSLTEADREKIAANKSKEKFRNTWIAVISLLVTVIGITNAMLMSVTERFREIGTMKCLGALSSFVTEMFVMEASLMGTVGGIAGALLGALFAVAVYTVTYGAGLVFSSIPLASVLLYGLYSVIAGVLLSIIAALYPARVAAAMVPATALRSTV